MRHLIRLVALQASSVIAIALCASLVAGCASPPAEEPVATSQSSRLGAVNADYTRALAAVESKYRRCSNEGHCTHGASLTAQLSPQGVRPLGLFGSDGAICDVLRPLAGLQHLYYFVGASASGGAVAQAGVGLDVVWDLWNQQAATFTYVQGGAGTLVGIEASAYVGYAFGSKSSVIDAWSGTFQNASASVGLGRLVSVGATFFRSPDSTILGASVSGSVGLSFIPLPAAASVTEGRYTAYDTGTTALGDSLWFVDYTEAEAASEGRNYTLLQFGGASDVALSLLETLTTLGTAPAAQAVALGVLQSSGLTIEDLCHVEAGSGP